MILNSRMDEFTHSTWKLLLSFCCMIDFRNISFLGQTTWIRRWDQTAGIIPMVMSQIQSQAIFLQIAKFSGPLCKTRPNTWWLSRGQASRSRKHPKSDLVTDRSSDRLTDPPPNRAVQSGEFLYHQITAAAHIWFQRIACSSISQRTIFPKESKLMSF